MIDALRILAAFGIVAGAGFSLLAAVGLVRFPDLYTRIHAASKAGVVGAGFILLALAVVSLDVSIVLRSIIAILFLLTDDTDLCSSSRTISLSRWATADVI